LKPTKNGGCCRRGDHATTETIVEHYNHCRYHESLGNLTPADVYFGRGHAILSETRKIKEETLRQRRLLNQALAA